MRFSRLRAHLSEIFPDDGTESELSILQHDTLSMHNIMVDESGNLTGIIDWECMSAVPLWKACDFPCFLDGCCREAKPDKKSYRYYPDTSEYDGLYWVHLLDYELTVLRRYFIDQMRSLDPGWIEVFESTQMKRDFEFAARHCDGMLYKEIKGWVDDLYIAFKMKIVSLSERI